MFKIDVFSSLAHFLALRVIALTKSSSGRIHLKIDGAEIGLIISTNINKNEISPWISIYNYIELLQFGHSILMHLYLPL